MDSIYDDLISIIVPVYNSERFLKRCVESLINQSYKNIEIILIDDGSLDGSPQICDEYSASDCRIKVIHKPNGGVSSARNTGLDLCEGQFISFVDSDDYVHPLFLEILYKFIKENNADISQCWSKFVSKDIDYNCIIIGNNFEIIDRNEALYRCVKKRDALYYCIACVKLFSKEVVKDIRFPEIVNAEDVKFCIDSFLASKKIIICNYQLYYYFKHPGSATTSNAYLSNNLIKVFDYFDKKCKEIILEESLLNDVLEASFLTKVDSVLEDYWNSYRLKNKERMKNEQETYKKMRIIAKNRGFRFRIKSYCFHINPAFFLLVRRIYMIIYRV